MSATPATAKAKSGTKANAKAKAKMSPNTSPGSTGNSDEDALYTFYYHPIGFRGNFVRHMLAFHNIPFEEALHPRVLELTAKADPKSLLGDPDSPLAMAPPLLYDVELGIYISQMPAIVQHLARKHMLSHHHNSNSNSDSDSNSNSNSNNDSNAGANPNSNSNPNPNGRKTLALTLTLAQQAIAEKILHDCNDVLNEITRNCGDRMWESDAQWTHFCKNRFTKWLHILEGTARRHGLSTGAESTPEVMWYFI